MNLKLITYSLEPVQFFNGMITYERVEHNDIVSLVLDQTIYLSEKIREQMDVIFARAMQEPATLAVLDRYALELTTLLRLGTFDGEVTTDKNYAAHFNFLHCIEAQPEYFSKAKITGSWVCNECGSEEFTGAVSEDDLEYLACSRCGCDEFHWEYK